MNSNGFFAAGFWKTLLGRLFAREFLENLMKLGYLQNFFHFPRQADHFHLAGRFHHGDINSRELADPGAVQILQCA